MGTAAGLLLCSPPGSRSAAPPIGPSSLLDVGQPRFVLLGIGLFAAILALVSGPFWSLGWLGEWQDEKRGAAPRLLPVWKPRRWLFVAAEEASAHRSSPCDIEAAERGVWSADLVMTEMEGQDEREEGTSPERFPHRP